MRQLDERLRPHLSRGGHTAGELLLSIDSSFYRSRSGHECRGADINEEVAISELLKHELFRFRGWLGWSREDALAIPHFFSVTVGAVRFLVFCWSVICSWCLGAGCGTWSWRSLLDGRCEGFTAAKAGHKEIFGPGRHAVASNLFCYIRDPWGSWVEYYADMDKISPAWRCKDFETLPYVWGPEWSPEFWGGEMNANLEPAG